jgi:hypothetical protein
MADRETFDIFSTYRHEVPEIVRQPSTRRKVSDDEDSSSQFLSPVPCVAPRPALPEDDESESEEEVRTPLTHRKATRNVWESAADFLPLFVGSERGNALAQDDADGFSEETPIVIDYDPLEGGKENPGYWVLEYEKSHLAAESRREKRKIRVQAKQEYIMKAHAEQLNQIKERKKLDVEVTRRELEATIKSLEGQLAPPRARKSAKASHRSPVSPEKQRASLSDAEELLGSLEAEIAQKSAFTDAVLAFMRKEISAFGAHLMAESNAIIALQKKKRVAVPFALPDVGKALTPEALNALVGLVETAYETLH